jgi:hypothetical protein
VWIIWLPKQGGYKIAEEVEELDDGACATRLTRIYQRKRSLAEDTFLTS